MGLTYGGVQTFRGYLALEDEWERQHEEERDQTGRAADQIANRCRVPDVPPASVNDCLAAELDRYIGEDHSDQDLQAQAHMAFWAQALFWLTVVTAIISFGGLILLIVSLGQTRRAISDTREIGEAQVRAYLSINVRDVAIEVADDGDGSNLAVKIRIEVANSGNTPAYSPIIYYDIEEAIPERIVPMAVPETMQRSPLSNSFISAKGVSPNTQLSRVFQVDDPVAFQRFDRLIRFSCCVSFLDEFRAERLTPVISGTFHHWPEGKFSFLPDNVHVSPQD